mmetsp:Transcript_80211/g.212893  ORF Transcript_80211/g.212893 Transcript_80211/m.212893 type:complete len:321 (+) Transcript_80211:262-1224(+)
MADDESLHGVQDALAIVASADNDPEGLGLRGRHGTATGYPHRRKLVPSTITADGLHGVARRRASVCIREDAAADDDGRPHGDRGGAESRSHRKVRHGVPSARGRFKELSRVRQVARASASLLARDAVAACADVKPAACHRTARAEPRPRHRLLPLPLTPHGVKALHGPQGRVSAPATANVELPVQHSRGAGDAGLVHRWERHPLAPLGVVAFRRPQHLPVEASACVYPAPQQGDAGVSAHVAGVRHLPFARVHVECLHFAVAQHVVSAVASEHVYLPMLLVHRPRILLLPTTHLRPGPQQVKMVPSGVHHARVVCRVHCA